MKNVVLLSGGIDSSVALALACFRDGPAQTLALGVSYGQRHINELQWAAWMTNSLGVEFFRAHLDPSPWKLLPLCTGDVQLDRPVYAMKTGGISNAFLPGRNVAFLSLALSVAGVTGARNIWIGANADDEAGFPDCRPPFFWAWQQMATHALGRGIHLETPLLQMNKREIVGLARSMALDLSMTWSCYRPITHNAGVKPCGRCDACILRRDAIDAMP